MPAGADFEDRSPVSCHVAAAGLAVNITRLIGDQILGETSIGFSGKPVQDRLLAGQGDFEDHATAQGAIATGDAAEASRAVEVTVDQHQSKLSLPLVLRAVLAALEGMQHFQLSTFLQLEHGAATAGGIATTRRNSVEVAGAVANQAADGNSAVGLASETVENGFFSLGIQLKHNASVIGWAAKLGRTVKVAIGVSD